ncbi:MAG: ABC transporter ATP-binding protein [Chloroflexi bacterium]|nr:ABC transporter ATP-binding protein [Chloroflexota bacterium]
MNRRTFRLPRHGDLLATYLRPLAAPVAALVVLLLASTGLQLAGPQVLRAFVDAALAGATAEYLRNVALLFVGLALVQQAAAVLATYAGERVGWSATNALREDLTVHCLRLDLTFHRTHSPGELIERIDGDVTALANFFSQFVVQIAGSLLFLFGVAALLWRVDRRAGLELTLFAAVALAAMIRVRAVSLPYWQAARRASAELFGFLEERLAGTEDIRAGGAVAHVLHRHDAHLRERVRRTVKAHVIDAVQWAVPHNLFTIQAVISLGLVVVLFRDGSITLGTALMIHSYTWLAFRPLRTITQQMEDFQKAGAGVVRIGELLRVRSALAQPAHPVPLPAGPLAVDFEGVSFVYPETDERPTTNDEMAGPDEPHSSFVLRPSSAPALQDISFHLPPGAVLGLVGRTGSGKTTISRLLFRFYDPTEGAIRLGGVDLRDARREEVRRRVGLVTQDVQLFRATVRENVTLFDDSVADARIWQALEAMGLAGWARALPHGLDTLIAAGDRGLSAGEAQLLALARVFLKNPGLVILDEASSRLDPATERLVERAVGRLLGRGGAEQRNQPSARTRTGIVIAHRLATIERADQILVLEYGRRVEYGLREVLARDPASRFGALLRTGREPFPAPSSSFRA